MNREIKFRAFVHNMLGGFMIPSENSDCFMVSNGNGFIVYDENKNALKNNEFKLMQFTGFKDFDEKEIYEGDILEYISYMRDENKRKEIVGFDEKCGGWYVHKQADTLSDVLFKQHNEEWQLKQNYKPSIKHKVRVIGNIYENPELLTI